MLTKLLLCSYLGQQQQTAGQSLEGLKQGKTPKVTPSPLQGLPCMTLYLCYLFFDFYLQLY